MKTRFLVTVLILSGLFITTNKSYGCSNESPEAVLEANPEYALRGEEVTLDGSGSYDPDGDIVKYEWDFEYDGVTFEPDYYETASYFPDGEFDGKTTYTYDTADGYTVMLQVTDDDSATDDTEETVVVNKVKIVEGGVYGTIQGAIDAAEDGDTIVVSPGTYTGADNRDIEFNDASSNRLIKVCSIDPDDPAVVAATVIDCEGSADDSRRGFYFHNNGDSGSELSGFTIKNGYYDAGTGYGGGIYCDGVSPIITNCMIIGNYARVRGGGIYCDDASPIITNCIFIDNIADSWGGGIYCCNNSSPTITNCFFNHNLSLNGGGMYNNGSSPKVVNCVFSKNRTGYDGGGICNNASSLTMINCTFSDNVCGTSLSPPGADGHGSGIRNTGSGTTTITNCIFWGDGYYQVGTDHPIYNTNASISVNYCDIRDGYNGVGNIDADPKFVDAGKPAGPDGIWGTIDDGLRLRTDSPCIDKGYNSIIDSEGIETDIIGRARIAEGDHIGDPCVDMGAYELPTIWYVDISDPGGDTGTSWEDAYDNLQDALTNTNIGDSNEIWVADGTYKPGTQRDDSFVLIEDVAVYGGFDGDETAREDRDWTEHKAILSGDLTGDDEPDFTNISDNSYHVVTGTDGAILDGFTIRAGNASVGSPERGYGAGIRCDSNSPIIRHCVIEDNNAIGFGGGMLNHNFASPVIFDCVFSGNKAGHGGGIYNYDHSNAKIVNCVFTGNEACYSGGGMYNDYFCSAELINCTLCENTATGDGGGLYNYTSSPKVTNCIFWDKDAGEDEEIYNNSHAWPTIRHCDIEGCGGSGDWDSSFGIDGGGNIDSDPQFLNDSIPTGGDDIFITADDGLQIKSNSPCVDAADGDPAPVSDIIGRPRIDIDGVDEGTGEPVYADMGAYEFTDSFKTVRFYTSSDYSDNYGYGLRDCQVHFSHKDGTGDCAYPNLYIEIDVTGGDSGIIDELTLAVTSESDSTGIDVDFLETGVDSNRYRAVEPIHLDPASNQTDLELKVLDEEILYVDGVEGPKVDRGEVATITADVGEDSQYYADKTADAIEELFDKDELNNTYFWWDGGRERGVESTSTVFPNFVKNVGNTPSSFPADFLIEVSHGNEGILNVLASPQARVNKPGTITPTIDSSDWEKDIEWAVLYSCNVLGQEDWSGRTTGWDPDKWTRYWDDALIRASNENNCHGILASSMTLAVLGGMEHIQGFAEALKDNNITVIDAYMETALEIQMSLHPWGPAALFHVENLDDRINDVTQDTDNTNMYYTWYHLAWDGGFYSILPREETWGTHDKFKVACDIPTDRPVFSKLMVRKESHQGKPFKHEGFHKASTDNKGRVKFRKRLKERGPIRLSRKRAKTKAAAFVRQQGGGMPADSELGVIRYQMVATFDAAKPRKTREEYIKKTFFEYTHKFNGIEIAGGACGDRILVGVEGDQVTHFDRHWRDVIGPRGISQQVISAGEALDIAIENIPKITLSPPDKEYLITQIKLFYYGLPSEEEEQYLTPAWGIRVGRDMWVYVNAFTGEFLTK